MALRARRSPHLREVLHDALLETFPREYPAKITLAHDHAENTGREYLVFFFPGRLGHQPRKRSQYKHIHLPAFHVMPNTTLGEADTKTSAVEAQMTTQGGSLGALPKSLRDSAVLVYRTRKRIESHRDKDSRSASLPSIQQIRYALYLLDQAGYSVTWMNASFKRLGATMRERTGRVETWLASRNRAQISRLIRTLKKS